jgi:hypothetical protein
MNRLLKAALAYLDRDWAALALCPPGHEGVPDHHVRSCRQPGKRPLGRWKAWQGRLPTLEEVAAQWELVPRANVGVVLGAVSGLVDNVRIHAHIREGRFSPGRNYGCGDRTT